MALPTITAEGNLVADPELRFTNSGAAVANFRMACNSKKKDQNGNWVDGDTTFLTVNVWNGLAENITEEVFKGQKVKVQGKLKQREYEKDGQKRTVFEVAADELSIPISRFSDKESKPAAQNGGGFGQANNDQPPF